MDHLGVRSNHGFNYSDGLELLGPDQPVQQKAFAPLFFFNRNVTPGYTMVYRGLHVSNGVERTKFMTTMTSIDQIPAYGDCEIIDILTERMGQVADNTDDG